MTPEPTDLRAVELPSGRVATVRPLDAEARRLLKRAGRRGGSLKLFRQAMARCIPDATPAEMATLGRGALNTVLIIACGGGARLAELVAPVLPEALSD